MKKYTVLLLVIGCVFAYSSSYAFGFTDYFQSDTGIFGGNDTGTYLYFPDVNNDNLPEIYKNGRLFLNNGNFQFQDITATAFPDTAHTYGMWGDFNNDGYIDFCSENQQYYRNNGNNTFTKMTGTTAVRWGFVADFNNDGIPDVFEYNGVVNFSLYIGKGDFTFSYKGVTGTGGDWGQTYCDVNGDGNFDVLNQRDGKLMMNKITDTGEFVVSNVVGLPASLQLPTYKSGDFDNDGIQEIDAQWYYENDGSGTFSATANPGVGNQWNCDVGDIDNDGYLDIIDIWNGAALQGFYLGNGLGQFTHVAGVTVFDGGISYLVDLNGDGKLDAVYVSYVKPYIYRNVFASAGAYLKIKPQGVESNKLGIGTKVFIYESGHNFDTAYLKGSCHIGAMTLSGKLSNTIPYIAHFGVDVSKKYDIKTYYHKTRKTQYRYNVSPNQLITVPENAFPVATINSLSVPNAIPANEITIIYSCVDDDSGDTMISANWAYSTDSVTWTSISQADLTGVEWMASGSSGTLKWNVSAFGITRMPTVYFRMRLYDSKDYGYYVVYGPFTINSLDDTAPQWTPDFKAEDAGYGTDNGWIYKIKLSWNTAVESVGDITYTIHVKVGDKDWEDLKTLTNETSCEVANVNGDVAYRFRIKSTDAYGNATDWYEATVTCRIKNEQSQTIDINAGGEVTLENYDNGIKETSKITIPQGATKAKIKSIKMKLIAPNLYDITAYDNADKVVNHPLFDKPVELTLVYDRSNILSQGFDEKDLGIFWSNERNEWLPLGGTVDATKHTVTTKVGHLSLFRISAITRTNSLKAAPSTFVLTPNGDGINDYLELNITYPENASSRDLKMDVYDILGIPLSSKTSSNSATMYWDCRDSNGRLAETGTYIIKISLEKDVSYITVNICR